MKRIVLLVMIAACGKGSSRDWTTEKTATMNGKAGETAFSIELPAGMRAQTPSSYGTRYELSGDGQLVASVAIEAPSSKTTFDQDTAFQLESGNQLFHEAPGESSFSYVYRQTSGGKPVGGAFGVVVLDAGGRQLRCKWELPTGRIKDKTLAEWPAMKRACESIKVVQP